MANELQPPAPPDDSVWRERFIAPPIGEDLRRLAGLLGRVTDDSTSPYLTRVKRLIVAGAVRDARITLFDETVWGTIRWRRTVGRPATAAMKDGFIIVHEYCLCLDVGVESEHIIGGWVPASTPQVWDGPDDAETHCVSFKLRGVTKWTNRIGVALIPGIDWQPADAPWLPKRGRAVRYPPSLLPGGEFTVPKGAAPMDLDTFEVVRTW